jgi:hypothetical protein
MERRWRANRKKKSQETRLEGERTRLKNPKRG